MASKEKEQPKNKKEQEAMEAAAEENTEAADQDIEAAEESVTEETASEDTDTENVSESPEQEDAQEDLTEEEPDGEEAENSDEVNSDNSDSSDKKEKKRHFVKTEKKEDKLKEQLNELNDKVVRQMAEFDNYRKRTEKEKQAMFETGAKSVIEKLLPVVDNFERGLAALEEGVERTPFEEGVLMTYKQLMTELEKLEVKPLDAVGKEFDPNLHNAVMHVDDESLGENIVVEELQKGYTYRDSVVRHSMVKVAN